MSGLPTNGMPQASVAAGTFPFTGNERVLVDTQLPNGSAPQTESVSLAQLTSLGFGAVVALVDAATIAIDCSVADYFSVTLGGNRTFAAFANPCPGEELVLEIKQDATGSRTATWNANVSWAGGAAPTLTVTAGAVDILRFTWNPTAGKWRGETVGKAFA